MTDVQALVEKIERQINSTKGVLEALGGNLKRAYSHVDDQMTHNPDDAHLVKQRDELNQFIEQFSCIVMNTLLAVGLRHISKDDLVSAVKRRM